MENKWFEYFYTLKTIISINTIDKVSKWIWKLKFSK